MREIVTEELNRLIEELGILADIQDDTVLYGSGGVLNSLALVRLIVALEERVLQDTQLSITLVDDKVLSATRSPFRTRSALIEFVSEKADEQRKKG